MKSVLPVDTGLVRPSVSPREFRGSCLSGHGPLSPASRCLRAEACLPRPRALGRSEGLWDMPFLSFPKLIISALFLANLELGQFSRRSQTPHLIFFFLSFLHFRLFPCCPVLTVPSCLPGAHSRPFLTPAFSAARTHADAAFAVPRTQARRDFLSFRIPSGFPSDGLADRGFFGSVSSDFPAIWGFFQMFFSY